MQPDGRILRAGCIKQSGGNDGYHRRGLYMAHAVAQIVDSTDRDADQHFVDVIVETPTNWFNEKGQASKDNEAIQRLYYFVGALMATLSAHPQVYAIWAVDPVQWKGTTPKDIMVARALKHAAAQAMNLPLRTPHDTCEAILLAKFGVNNYNDGATGIEESYKHPLRVVHVQGVLCTDGSFAQEDFIDDPEGDS